VISLIMLPVVRLPFPRLSQVEAHAPSPEVSRRSWRVMIPVIRPNSLLILRGSCEASGGDDINIIVNFRVLLDSPGMGDVYEKTGTEH
jgi:hypothetical protein